MSRLVAFVLLAAGVSAGSPVYADGKCEPGEGIEMSGGTDSPWAIQLQIGPEGVPLNEPFDAGLTICSRSERYPARVSVDATMPAHKHGMNYQPDTAKIDDGRYEVKNLLFHMPGMWRLEVTAYDNDKPHRFTHDVNVQ